MITVIIPTYNREKVIARSIASVLNQSYRDLEVIVVDDCCKDDTQGVVEEFKDPRLKYVRLAKNSGACAARNRGIEIAQGDYIAFQDSDDEWHYDKVELQLRALEEHKADIVFCGFEKVMMNGRKKIHPTKITEGFYSQRQLMYESLVSTQTILGKAKVISNIRFDVKMPCMQDYDFIIRASERYSIYYINQRLVTVYEQDNCITPSKGQYNKRQEVTELLLNKYKNLGLLYPEWELKMLKILAHCKVMLNEEALTLLRSIRNEEKTMINLIKIIMYRAGLLHLYYKAHD